MLRPTGPVSLRVSSALPEPARALGYRGYARASLGDEEGLNEMERALSLLVDAGVGFDAAILQNNVAIARYPLQGPARSLAAFEQGITFCEERGLTAVALFTAANCPGLLAELGRTNEATERADALIAALEGTGSAQDPCEVRASELAVRVAQGRGSTADEVESLIATTRTVGQVDVNVLGFAVAAAALVDEVPREACRLLAELDRFPGVRGSSYYARQLPGMIRTALRSGDAALAKELADGIEPRYPLEEHALNAARAQLAERDGDIAGAATLYAEAADRWLESAMLPSAHTRCSATVGVSAGSIRRTPRRRSAQRANCSQRWATPPRSPKSIRCSTAPSAKSLLRMSTSDHAAKTDAPSFGFRG